MPRRSSNRKATDRAARLARPPIVTEVVPRAEWDRRIRAYRGSAPTGGIIALDQRSRGYELGVASGDPGFAPLVLLRVVFPDWPVPRAVWEEAVAGPSGTLAARVRLLTSGARRAR